MNYNEHSDESKLDSVSGEELEYKANVLAAKHGSMMLRHRSDLGAIDIDIARGREVDAAEQV